jgi:hypothetical protein
MNEIEQRLIAYISASSSARAVLSEIHGLELNAFDIQSALEQVLDIHENPPLGLLDKGLSSSQIVEELNSFDFKKFKSEILAELIEEEPLIPENIPRLLTEQTIKTKGEIWQIHKSDVDAFPSVPHAHNYETGVVLHLGSGDMYDRNRIKIGAVGCKKLLLIRGKLKGISLPNTQCE